MRKETALWISLVALACGGCGLRGRRPAEPAPHPGASAPAPAEGELDRVRQSVREFMKQTYPGSSVEGVWTLPLSHNYCIAGADATLGAQRRTVDLLVRKYVRQNGADYWRAEALDGGFAASLHGPPAASIPGLRPPDRVIP